MKSNDDSGQQVPISSTMNPGDEAPSGTAGTGEKLCSNCGGKGKDDLGRPCAMCAGTGRVTAGIGGA